MAELTAEQDEQVQYLIAALMEKKGLSRAAAVRQLHLFVCRGTCKWYARSGGSGMDFDTSQQTPEHLEQMRTLLRTVSEERNVGVDDLKRWFHIFECHR